MRTTFSGVNSPTKQAARNALFAAALEGPQPALYATHHEYAQAFEAYQAATMQPLREELAAA